MSGDEVNDLLAATARTDTTACPTCGGCGVVTVPRFVTCVCGERVRTNGRIHWCDAMEQGIADAVRREFQG